MKKFFLALIAGILLAAAGTAIYTWYGYKDNIWIQGTGYVLLVFGWLILGFILFFIQISIRASLIARVPVASKIITGLYFLVYPAWLIVLVIAFMKLDDLKDAHIQKVLSTGDVVFTSAKIVRMEERRVKSTSHVYAIIEYNADGSAIHQAIRDDNGRFYNKKEINIKYSKKYKDMFVVLDEMTPTLQ